MLDIGLGISIYFIHEFSGGVLPPQPPYIIAATDAQIIYTIPGLTYEQGSGPSNESTPFKIMALGLMPTSGNILVTPSVDIEIFDGTDWLNTPFNIPYTSGSINTGLIYKVRLKAALSSNSYDESLILSGANASDWNISIPATVTPGTFISASGGVESIVGNRKIHVFLSSGSFIVNSLGSGTNNNMDYLIVAGGGAGGSDGGSYGGGGGGGGVLPGTITAIIDTYPVLVGLGGTASFTNQGGNGQNSTFAGLSAIGGGGGGGLSNHNGLSGGSGGGSTTSSGIPGGSGTVDQGFDGGAGSALGGGGGGGGSTAGIAGNGVSGGNGGDGFLSSITGTPTYYGGGGGGGGNFLAGNAGAGGLGGGGHGGGGGTGTQPGGTNTGGGGGGDTGPGGTGGSGIVVVSYLIS